MQILCGLQVVFFLFNCQTPEYIHYSKKTLENKSVMAGFRLFPEIWSLIWSLIELIVCLTHTDML